MRHYQRRSSVYPDRVMCWKMGWQSSKSNYSTLFQVHWVTRHSVMGAARQPIPPQGHSNSSKEVLCGIVRMAPWHSMQWMYRPRDTERALHMRPALRNSVYPRTPLAQTIPVPTPVPKVPPPIRVPQGLGTMQERFLQCSDRSCTFLSKIPSSLDEHDLVSVGWNSLSQSHLEL